MAIVGLCVPVAYAGFAVASKTIATNGINTSLAKKQLTQKEIIVTPTPFNAALWYAIARDTAGYYIGYRSVFDKHTTDFTYHSRNDQLITGIQNRADIVYLKKFADNFYTVENRNDTLLFNVLRFGKVAGWYHPEARFMLYYYINYPQANELAVQRGRFQGWNRRTIKAYLERILGKP